MMKDMKIFLEHPNVGMTVDRLLFRLTKTEQKEFFFARKVLLVEGETEVGAFPIFAEKLNYNLDLNSVSVISVGSNYFVGMIKILQEFHIPFLIVCDSDTILEIRGTIKSGQQKIKTSSLFIQLDRLCLLEPSDKSLITTLENHIISIPNEKFTRSYPLKVLDDLKNVPNIPVEAKSRIERSSRNFENKVYESSIRSTIQKLIDKVIDKYHFSLRVWDEDFEGLFDNSLYARLIKEVHDLYGDNKVLQGTYMALNTPTDKIPKPIEDIINQLRSLEITNSY